MWKTMTSLKIQIYQVSSELPISKKNLLTRLKRPANKRQILNTNFFSSIFTFVLPNNRSEYEQSISNNTDTNSQLNCCWQKRNFEKND